MLLATVTHWAVPSMSDEMRLPDAEPKDGEKGFYFMKVQVKENGNVSNIDYFFPDDWAFATKDLGRLSRHQLGLE